MSKLEELCEELKKVDWEYAVKSGALALEILREREEIEITNRRFIGPLGWLEEES